MFKKITSTILALLMILSFAGCAQTDTDPTDASNFGSTEGSTEAQGIEVDENLLTVDITLPASFFGDKDMSTFDADAYADENGYLSAKLNEDNSVTVKMTQLKYTALLNETAASLETSFAEFIEAEDTPYIKGITHNDDFTTITIEVDRAAYESAFDFSALSVSLAASLYQAIAGVEFHVDVVYVDAASGETFKTVTYPQN